MGLFDRFKGNPSEERKQRLDTSPAPSPILQDIIKAYSLKETEPYEQSMEGTWWEGTTGATRFAVTESTGRLFVHIGTIDEITDIYLGRATEQRPLPLDNAPTRIDGIVKDHQVARQFFLLAHPQGAFDLPQLRLPAVLNALLHLSQAVDEVMIYENYKGMTLVMAGQITRAAFDRDLARGVEMVNALEAGNE